MEVRAPRVPKENPSIGALVVLPGCAERDRAWKALRETGTVEHPVAATFVGSLIKVLRRLPLFHRGIRILEDRITSLGSINTVLAPAPPFPSPSINPNASLAARSPIATLF